jgi:hypothetical protein
MFFRIHTDVWIVTRIIRLIRETGVAFAFDIIDNAWTTFFVVCHSIDVVRGHSSITELRGVIVTELVVGIPGAYLNDYLLRILTLI